MTLSHSNESLILAQDERWRRVLGMQVERAYALHFVPSFGAQATLTNRELRSPPVLRSGSLLLRRMENSSVAMSVGEWQTGE